MQHEQGTEEWRKARAGKVTASRISEVVAKTKSGYSTSRANYAAQLIAERLTGQPQEKTFTNSAIQWGTEKEPEARSAYEFFSGHSVVLSPFVVHPVLAKSGASPDGFVNEDGLLEVKCPLTSTHIETLLGEEIDKKYLLQMQWQIACTGRKWCDFVSYDPRLPSDLQLHIRRVERDDKLIRELENEVSSFLAEIEKKVVALQSLRIAA
jgi:putative phage-type endonuclease